MEQQANANAATANTNVAATPENKPAVNNVIKPAREERNSTRPAFVDITKTKSAKPDPLAMLQAHRAKTQAQEAPVDGVTGQEAPTEGEVPKDAPEGTKEESTKEEAPKEEIKKDRAYFLQKQEERRAFKKEQEEFKKQKETFQKDTEEAQAFKEVLSKAKDNPIALLKSAGIELNDFLSALAEGKFDGTYGDPPTTEQQIEQTIKRKMEEHDKALQEQRDNEYRAQFEAAIATTKRNINNLITTSDKFPLAKAKDLSETIFETWTQLVEAEGNERQIPLEEAANLVEEYEKAELLKLYPLIGQAAENAEKVVIKENNQKTENSQKSTKPSPKKQSLSNKAVASAMELTEEDEAKEKQPKSKHDLLSNLIHKHIKK